MSTNFTKLNKILDSVAISNTAEEIESQKQEVAYHTGLSPDKIRARVETFAHKNARQGVICALHIGRARFEQGLTPPDLGIDIKDKEIKEYLDSLSLGRRLLVAGEYRRHLYNLSTIEQRARRKLEYFSVPTAWGRFVPYKLFREMKQFIDEQELEYRIEYNTLIDQLYSIRHKTELVLTEASVSLYKMLKKDWTAEPPFEFTDNFVNKALSAFPSRQEVETSYLWDMEVSFVPLTQANQEMEAVMALQTETAEAQREVVAHLRETYQEQVGEFVADIMSHVRQLAHETCSAALGSYQKHGSFPGATIAGLRNCIQRLEALNVTEDEEVLRQVETIRAIVDQPARTRDVDSLGFVLGEIVEENRQFLLGLGRQPRQVRDVGSPVEPETVLQHRQARENIKIETDVEIDFGRQQRMVVG